MTKILIASATSILVLSPAFAQSWSSDQQGVLDVVLESWEAIAARDVNWTDDFVHENAIVWSDQRPMPMARASVKEWDRFEFATEDMLTHTISPAAIVVEGSTAIVHYYYSLGMEDRDGDRETVHGRCSDILVADGASWKFISWNCGDDVESDD